MMPEVARCANYLFKLKPKREWEMKWINRHLNWSFVIWIYGWFGIVILASIISKDIGTIFCILASLSFIFIDIWVLIQKKRGVGAFLITLFIFPALPLFLNNLNPDNPNRDDFAEFAKHGVNKINKPNTETQVNILSTSSKEPILSDSEPSQTSVVHRFDGCNETDTHSDKTGDI